MDLRDIFFPVKEDLKRVQKVVRDRICGYGCGNTALKKYVSQNTGKMIRPALLVLSARAAGIIDKNKVSKMAEIAAVIEIIHTASLLHDDVLDNGKIRRRQPTVNAKWGNKAAILMGDYLFSAAFSMMTAYPDEAKIVSAGAMDMCDGEITQNARANDLGMTESEYIDIINAKSARMFEMSCRLGARLAGADSVLECALARYGRCTGIAYQIFDDLLDMAGSDEESGKSLGSDSFQGKITLPLLYLRDISPQFLQYATREDMKLMTGRVLKKIFIYLGWAEESLAALPASVYSRSLRDFTGRFRNDTNLLYGEVFCDGVFEGAEARVSSVNGNNVLQSPARRTGEPRAEKVCPTV